MAYKYNNQWLNNGECKYRDYGDYATLTDSQTAITIYPVATTATGNSIYYQYVYPYQSATTGINYEITNWYNAMAGNAQGYMLGGLGGLAAQPPETPEEKVAREARKAKREAAALRAERLLFTVLTPTQVKQYTDDEYFDVPIRERIYRIRKGYSRNVELIEAGKATARYCAHPEDACNVPHPDAMLAQLLMLKSNEAEFLRLANKTVLQ